MSHPFLSQASSRGRWPWRGLKVPWVTALMRQDSNSGCVSIRCSGSPHHTPAGHTSSAYRRDRSPHQQHSASGLTDGRAVNSTVYNREQYSLRLNFPGFRIDLHNKRKGTGFELGTIYFFFVLSCVFKIDILKNYYFWLFWACCLEGDIIQERSPLVSKIHNSHSFRSCCHIPIAAYT